jgi:hypothetical protein
MAGVEHERKQREEVEREEFRKAWAERLKQPAKPVLPPSTLHQHTKDCLSEPFMHKSATTAWQSIRVRRCSQSGVIVEA